MKYKPWVRLLSLLMLFAMFVGSVPLTIASNKEMDLKTENATESALDDIEPEHAPSAEDAREDTEEPTEQEPTDMNGETLTRHAVSTGGRMRARSAAYGSVGKSTCVEFAGYTSPYWYCNRYSTLGSHVYGHYYYAAVIAYHTVDGEWAYCIERATRS